VTPRGRELLLVAPRATRVELLLSAIWCDAEPIRRVRPSNGRHRSGDLAWRKLKGWGSAAADGYGCSGPLTCRGCTGSSGQVLLDPCARAIDGLGRVSTPRRGGPADVLNTSLLLGRGVD